MTGSWPPAPTRCTGDREHAGCNAKLVPGAPRGGHEKDCTWKSERERRAADSQERHARTEAATAARRAEIDAAAGRDEEPADAGEGAPTMSTKSTLRAAGIDTKLAGMTVEQLRDEAGRLEIEGRSKLTTRAQLEKAITKAKKAKAPAAPRAASNGDAEQIVEYGDLKVNGRVRVVRNVDLSERTAGFNGVVPKDATGKVLELRPSGGGGVQVVADLKDVGQVAIGARHFEPLAS